MGEIRTVTTLKHKVEEIRASIRMYEKKLAQAKSDLAHVNAAIRIFDPSDRPQDIARYVDSYRLFKRGEPWAICAAALASGPLTTKDLALALMRRRGWTWGIPYFRRPSATGLSIRFGCRRSGGRCGARGRRKG
jgi:hypothetical protein